MFVRVTVLVISSFMVCMTYQTAADNVVLMVSPIPVSGGQVRQACSDWHGWSGYPLFNQLSPVDDRYAVESSRVFTVDAKNQMIDLNITIGQLTDGRSIPLYQRQASSSVPIDVDMMLWWGSTDYNCHNWTTSTADHMGMMVYYFATLLDGSYVDYCYSRRHVLCVYHSSLL
jgi:hypothetical protein